MKKEDYPETHEWCSFCGFETTSERYSNRNTHEKNGPPYKYLCEACANTLCGNAHDYPDQYPHKHIMKQISWGINRILQEIRTLKQQD